jgi:hypothetical protein
VLALGGSTPVLLKKGRSYMIAFLNRVLLFALAAPCFLIGIANAQTAQIEDIRVQLFYERSGTLSEDLTKLKKVSLWNTIIGEGDAKEPANSFLVSVEVRGKPESFNKGESIAVTVFDKAKKSMVMQRRFDGLLFGKDGRLVKPVFVENRTCAPLEITARGKSSVKTVTLPFACGE